MEQAPLEIINERQEQFEAFVRTMNPTFAFYVDGTGCPITDAANVLDRAKAFCMICENPKSYENKGCVNNAEKMTQTNFNYVTSGIRQAVTGQNDMCSGQLNKAFFSDIQENADVVFILYNIQGDSVSNKKYRFAGFVCCNDLSMKDEDGDYKHHPDDCDEEGGEEGAAPHPQACVVAYRHYASHRRGCELRSTAACRQRGVPGAERPGGGSLSHAYAARRHGCSHRGGEDLHRGAARGRRGEARARAAHSGKGAGRRARGRRPAAGGRARGAAAGAAAF